MFASRKEGWHVRETVMILCDACDSRSYISMVTPTELLNPSFIAIDTRRGNMLQATADLKGYTFSKSSISASNMNIDTRSKVENLQMHSSLLEYERIP